MSAENPYSPPAATVKDVVEPSVAGGFLPEGRKVDAGRGLAWITEAFSMVFAAPGNWVLLWLAMFVILLILGMIPLLGIVSYVLTPVLMAGVIHAAARQDSGDTFEVGDLFAGFREKFGPLALSGLLFVVAATVIGGGLALILGFTVFASLMGGGSTAIARNLGIIIIAMPLILVVIMAIYSLVWFAPALILRHDFQPVDAMKLSMKVTLRNWAAVLVYGIAAFVVVLIAAIPFGLGLLIAGPALLVSFYTAYRDLFLAR